MIVCWVFAFERKMAKRVADKYITDQNWDREEDSDENAGTGEFKRANIDALKNRVIRKAKRRMPPTGENKVSVASSSRLYGVVTLIKHLLHVSFIIQPEWNVHILRFCGAESERWIWHQHKIQHI